MNKILQESELVDAGWYWVRRDASMPWFVMRVGDPEGGKAHGGMRDFEFVKIHEPRDGLWLSVKVDTPAGAEFFSGTEEDLACGEATFYKLKVIAGGDCWFRFCSISDSWKLYHYGNRPDHLIPLPIN